MNPPILSCSIEAGECDLGLTNHYYLARALEEDPDFPVAPAWPDRYGSLRITNLPLAGGRAEVTVGADGVHLGGLDQDIEVVREPRDPLAVPV